VKLVAADRPASPRQTSPRRAPLDRRVGLAAWAAALAAVGFVVAAATLGGAAAPAIVGDPGPVTRWGVLLTRTAHDVAAMGTIGVLALAVLLLPTSDGALLPDAARLVRLASRWAVAWASAALLGVLMTLSQATGRPLQDVLTSDAAAIAMQLPQTRALVSTVWLAGLAAVWARSTRSTAGGWLVLLTAIAALLPPLLTGHAAHQEEQSAAAVVGLVVHVGTASLWAGGLVALALHLRRSPVALTVALPRYSRMALACFLAVGLSGAVTGWTAFAEASQLWTTSYGQLLLGKVGLLAVLGLMGHLHRRRTLRAVAAGRPRAFLALAVAELVLMAGVAGLAVGLSHTAPPPQPDHGAVAAPA
jgi:putative copper resistance protein D